MVEQLEMPLFCVVLISSWFSSHAFDPLSIDSHPDVLQKLYDRDLHPSIALTENSVYRKESDAFRGVEFDEKAQGNANPEWRKAVNQLFTAYRPKYHPLWLALKNAPKEVDHFFKKNQAGLILMKVLTNKWWLREFYKRYQAAMHVTRVQVFFDNSSPLTFFVFIAGFQDSEHQHTKPKKETHCYCQR